MDPPFESPVCDHRNVANHDCTNTNDNDKKNDNDNDTVNSEASRLLVDSVSSPKKNNLREVVGVVKRLKPNNSYK